VDSFPEQPWGPHPNARPPESEAKMPVFTEPHWTLIFDGSVRKKRARASVVLTDPNRDQVKYIVHLEFEATNNMAEYEVLIFGLTAALSLGVQQLLVKGDSQMIIK
jgi:ribonuclease HI